jgi:hypothetical protein
MKSETEIKTLTVLLREKLKELESKSMPKDAEKGVEKILSEMHLKKAITLMEWVLK